MKIAIICAGSTPIPATRGGATETMMTHLLEVNEELKEHHFYILGYYDDEAAKKSLEFPHSTFYHYIPKVSFEKLEAFFWRLLRKVSRDHIFIKSRYIRWCAEIINQSDFDVVVLEGNCFQVQYLRSLIGSKKIILHMHIDYINRDLKAAGKMIKAADGLFAISQFCKNRMIEVDAGCKIKTIVVKNTIDVERFTYKGDTIRNEIRKKLGISKNQIVVSYCGRLSKTKGVLELIEAINKINDPKIHLLIIGSSVYLGSAKDSYIENLEKYSRTIPGGVSFTGYIRQTDLPNYLSAADIAVVPSICNEAAGNVTIEALACGVPVIASSQGGIPEYAELKACRLVDYDEQFVEGIAEKIKELIDDDELYCRLKSNARDVAVQYDKHNYYRNFCNAVKTIINL